MSAAHTSKIRIYDLAKELKMESKRLIEEVRREGVDVSVPSNTISKELAEKIRNKYFPKKEAPVKREIRVVKKAKHVEDAPAEAPEPSDAPAPEVYAEPHAPEVEAAPAEQPSDAATTTSRPLVPRVLKKLTPAVRAERPEQTESHEQQQPAHVAGDADGGLGAATAHAPAEISEPEQIPA